MSVSWPTDKQQGVSRSSEPHNSVLSYNPFLLSSVNQLYVGQPLSRPNGSLLLSVLHPQEIIVDQLGSHVWAQNQHGTVGTSWIWWFTCFFATKNATTRTNTALHPSPGKVSTSKAHWKALVVCVHQNDDLQGRHVYVVFLVFFKKQVFWH